MSIQPPTWPKGALRRTEAAEYLSISTVTLWKLVSTGRIKRTSYGTYAVAELDRHLSEEIGKDNQ